MVHVGSWRDPSVKDEEVVDGLLCRDIRFYGGDLRRVFATERPNATYVLNVGGAVDRLVNRICRNLNIKTVFLMHGVMPLGKNIDVEKKRLNQGFSIVKRLSKVLKYLRIYGLHLGEVARTNFFELFNPRTYGHMIYMIVSPGSVYADPWVDKDLYPDLTLLYSEAYRKHFIERMKFNPDSIKVVGNPQLDPVLQLACSPDSKAQISALYARLGIPGDKPVVVFLVDGLDVALGSFTEEEWLQELRDVAEAVRCFGGHLVLKLHPTNNRSLVEKAFDSFSHVNILQNEVNLSIVLGSIAVVGHISSALMIPVALNIPVLVPRWSRVYSEFDYYISNNVALPVSSSKELVPLLKEISDNRFFSDSCSTEFFKYQITFTDGRSWERIAAEILGILKSKTYDESTHSLSRAAGN